MNGLDGLGVLDRENRSSTWASTRSGGSPMLARADMGFIGRAKLGW